LGRRIPFIGMPQPDAGEWRDRSAATDLSRPPSQKSNGRRSFPIRATIPDATSFTASPATALPAVGVLGTTTRSVRNMPATVPGPLERQVARLVLVCGRGPPRSERLRLDPGWPPPRRLGGRLPVQCAVQAPDASASVRFFSDTTGGAGTPVRLTSVFRGSGHPGWVCQAWMIRIGSTSGVIPARRLVAGGPDSQGAGPSRALDGSHG
jgi:hypothetical protein